MRKLLFSLIYKSKSFTFRQDWSYKTVRQIPIYLTDMYGTGFPSCGRQIAAPTFDIQQHATNSHLSNNRLHSSIFESNTRHTLCRPMKGVHTFVLHPIDLFPSGFLYFRSSQYETYEKHKVVERPIFLRDLWLLPLCCHSSVLLRWVL